MNKVKCPQCSGEGVASLYMNGDQEYMSVSWRCDCHKEEEFTNLPKIKKEIKPCLPVDLSTSYS